MGQSCIVLNDITYAYTASMLALLVKHAYLLQSINRSSNLLVKTIRKVSPRELGLDPLLLYNATADDAIVKIVQLCNPAEHLSDMTSHTTLLRQCTSLFLF